MCTSRKFVIATITNTITLIKEETLVTALVGIVKRT
jgi:hypothetical protein